MLDIRYILRSLTGKMVLVSAPLLALVFVFSVLQLFGVGK